MDNQVHNAEEADNNGVKRRGLFKVASLATAATGASALFGPSLGNAQASGTQPARGSVEAGPTQEKELLATYASQIKVTAFGVNVGTGDTIVDTAAVQAAIDAASATGSAVVFPAGRTYNVTGIKANSGAHLVVETGAEIVCHGDSYGIVACGSAETLKRTVTSGAFLGSSAVVLSNVDGLRVGDWLLLTADASIGATNQKRGMLRSVIGLRDSEVLLDGPIYTNLAGAVAIKISLAKPLMIDGGGRIRGASPANQYKALIRALFVLEPSISGVTVGPGGGPGLQLDHCVGGWSSAHYADLLDDPSTNHYGYAVNWGGATRGHVIRGGSATRIRHGVTTNACNSEIAGLTGARGEPEACVATSAFLVSDSRSAGLDTHEAGQGCMLFGSVFNCAIGIQDRATNTVMSGTVQGADLYGYYVTASSVNPILINPTVLAMGIQTGAAAYRIAAPATLESPYYPVATAGVPAINATADYTIRGGGFLAGNTIGPGARKVGLLGKASTTQSGTADIKQSLVELGVLEAGAASLTSGLVSLTATGTIQSRLQRVAATAGSDVPFRADGVNGATGDLAQYRVNGAPKVRVGPNGDVEITDSAAGLILRSPDNARYRLTVSNSGSLLLTKI